MVFANLIFLYLFLPLNLLFYFITKNNTYRNIVLILFSLLFYAWGEPVWVFVLMFSVGIDYWNGRIIQAKRGTVWAKAAVALSAVVNLSLLVLFKYSGLIVETLNTLFAASLPVPQFNLPIGISFYSFQALSYVIDCYRGDAPVQNRYYKLLLYVSLYPQLVAGPIVRYSHVAAEIDNRRTNARNLFNGLSRMAVGLTKKVLVANTAGKLLTDYTLAPQGELSIAGAWFGMILFSLQIYYDFSGYSDMAIGLGEIFGFHYHENFNYPYISRSATGFWRRWHISLSSFFRDYVYIPLGGNRQHVYFNLLVVWLLTGLWHGASWNYVLWGIFYGLLIMLEKRGLLNLLERLPSVLSHIYLLFVTVIGWTIFYFDSNVGGLSGMLSYLSVMFGGSRAPLWDARLGIVIMNHLFWLIFSILFCMPVLPRIKKFLASFCSGRQVSAVRVAQGVLCVAMLFLCTCLLVGKSFNPFLYSRF